MNLPNKDPKRKTLLAVDGNSILNRAFYGIRPLTTADGRPTGALFGMLNILLPQIQKWNPDYLLAAFDLPSPTFRHTLYEGYKGDRKPMPQELREQLEPAKELLRALGFAVLEKEGYEADDFLGTVSRLAEEEGNTVSYLLTGDRDALQLISRNTGVLLVKTKDTTLYTPEVFRETYGVLPEQYVDVKALMGDSSDCIPGVKGIGEKTAFSLIAAFGSLNELYRRIEELPEGAALEGVKPAALKKLREGREDARLSRTLSAIFREIPIRQPGEEEQGLSALRYRGIHKEDLRRLLCELEFSSFLRRLGLTEESPMASAANSVTKEEKRAEEQKNPTVKDSFDEREGHNSKAEKEKGSALPPATLETAVSYPLVSPKQASERLLEGGQFALSAEKGDSLLLRFCDEKNLGFSIEIAPDLSAESRKVLSDLLASPNISYTVFHQKALRLLLRKHLHPDCDFRADFDAMIAAWILQPDQSFDGKEGESAAVLAHLSLALTEDGVQKNPAILFPLRDTLQTKLQHSGQERLYREIELPLSALLADMEELGAMVNREGLSAFAVMLEEKANALEEEIFALSGHPFNISSPKQLGQVLFEEMGLPPLKKTKSGYSTSAEVLEKLAPICPMIPLIFEYRQAVKLRSTYAVALQAAADHKDRVHTCFRQTGTATGRLSSAEPNLQNIPIRTPLGRELRRFFRSREGYALVDADYSQIELRVLAALAKDQTMIEAFSSGVDIHTGTASQVFGVPEEAVTPELRSRAKAVNFGIVYGISDFSLGQDIGVPKAVAGEYIRSYRQVYSGIDRFLLQTVEKAKEDGYVTTAFGRRRYVPELRSGKAMLRAFGERIARNSPIQGTAADIIKVAMLQVDKRLKEEHLTARLILQVHDELIVEAPLSEVPAVETLLKEEMEAAYSTCVPFTVDIHSGKTWFDCK